MAAPRRRKIIGHRRRVEDEGEDEGGPAEPIDLDDDSMTEGSIGTDDHDAGGDSDTSNVDETSPTAPNVRKATTGNGAAKPGRARQPADVSARDGNVAPKNISATDAMLHGLSAAEGADPPREMHFDDLGPDSPTKSSAPAAPIVVSSASASRQPSQAPAADDRRRRGDEEYNRRRDEDPAFVPTRGGFFMHDNRDGFRPFAGRGRGRRGGAMGLVQYVVYHLLRSV